MKSDNPYEYGLDKNPANYVPLTPLSFLERCNRAFPNRTSLIYGNQRYTWQETTRRCHQLASGLQKLGVQHGDTVSIMCPNTPPMYEAHFGVPMSGAVLNSLNTRLDASTVAVILDHSETNVLLADTEYSSVVDTALGMVNRDISVIDIIDDALQHNTKQGSMDYETLISQEKFEFFFKMPEDEWDAISLNYTSGTTGNPKGVVYHHRGAYLNVLSIALDWQLPFHPVYLWTLPMFHCNGWCFPWTMAMMTGTNVCLRQVNAKNIYDAIADHGVTHFCGAPIVLGMVTNASNDDKREFDHLVKVMTAAAPPPASVLAQMEASGFHMTHVYGLTETYGPAVICAWNQDWNDLSESERAQLKSRQGVPNIALNDLQIQDPETMQNQPSDKETLGEVMFQGNNVMKGYLKNPTATQEAFEGGWFHSGDLGVMHPDNYIQLKDRSKDIIISGGENISSIEIEDVLFEHPAVMAAAVVARNDEKWGETPCAFVTLNPNAEPQPTEAELIEYCKMNMARFKAPRTVVFCELPKTSTGKIQKFKLRELANSLE